jgi:hypothetical protein
MEYSQNMDTPYTLRRGSKLQSLSFLVSYEVYRGATRAELLHIPLCGPPFLLNTSPTPFILLAGFHLFLLSLF